MLTGRERLIDHDAILVHQRIPSIGTLLLSLAAWQVIVAGTLLPASQGQAFPRLAQVGFLGGYVLVWTGFAVVALTTDDGLHTLVDHWAWLARNEFIISASLFVVAGTFQFSSFKERCLQECRSPLSFFWRYYQHFLLRKERICEVRTTAIVRNSIWVRPIT